MRRPTWQSGFPHQAPANRASAVCRAAARGPLSDIPVVVVPLAATPMVQTGSAVPQTADPLSRVGCLDCAAGHRTIVSRPRAVPVRMGQCLPLPAQRAYCPSAVRGEDTCLRATGQRHSEVRRSLGGTDRARMIRSKAATGRGAPVKEGGLAWSRPPTSARTR